MTTLLRLSNILGRGVALEWFEAVAVVQEVSERVRDSAGGRAVPELDQVQLAFDGTVSITGTSKADDPVRRLGQMLQACLVDAEPPVQLRLVVSQATAPEPTFNSIRDYSEALTYFERPDRSAILRNLYEKAQAASMLSVEDMPTLDVLAPLEAAQPERKRRDDPPAQRKSRRGVLAVAAVVLLVAAAAVYSRLDRAAHLRTDVSALAVKTSDAVGTTLVKGISAVSETVGLGRLVPAGGSGAPPPAKPAVQANPEPVEVASGTTKRTKQTPAPFKVFDLAALPFEADSPQPLVPPEAQPDTRESPAVVIPDLPEVKVYSAEDRTVVPPIGLRPQLPRALPSDVRREQLSRIELVVLSDGTVGSVKLLGPGRGVLDGMFLSAAKAWTFKPAEKDGRPVAFRKTVWLVRE